MLNLLSAWASLALVGVQASAPPPPPMPPVARVIIHDEVIWRIPVAPPRVSPMRWVERKGPSCIKTGQLAGALLSGPGQVDFLLRDGKRVRAKLDQNCTGLGFYRGFYVGSQDNRLCARRDEIASRMGDSCRIGSFRKLEWRAR